MSCGEISSTRDASCLQRLFHSLRRQDRSNVICFLWHYVSLSFKLKFPYSSTEAEYEALIIRLIFTLQMGVHKIYVQGNYRLNIRQVNGELHSKRFLLYLIELMSRSSSNLYRVSDSSMCYEYTISTPMH